LLLPLDATLKDIVQHHVLDFTRVLFDFLLGTGRS
jgi:hypothetical protein